MAAWPTFDEYTIERTRPTTAELRIPAVKRRML
jgi:hypothetical protein